MKDTKRMLQLLRNARRSFAILEPEAPHEETLRDPLFPVSASARLTKQSLAESSYFYVLYPASRNSKYILGKKAIINVGRSSWDKLLK